MKYYAIFDTNGSRITTYVEGIYENIPTEAIEITEEEQNLYCTGEYIRDMTTGKPVKKPVYVPTSEEIKQQKLDELDSAYNPKFDALTLAWATASMSGNVEMANARKADKEALTLEYNTKKGDIEND
jgi:hypothetical protein